jgi:hypothetical protein
MCSKKSPCSQSDRVVEGIGFRREIPGEGRAVIKKERDAMIRVAGRMQDFSGNSDLAKEVAALLA